MKILPKSIKKDESLFGQLDNSLIFSLGITLGILVAATTFIDAREFYGIPKLSESDKSELLFDKILGLIFGFGSGFAIGLLLLKISARSYFNLTVATIFFFLSIKYYSLIGNSEGYTPLSFIIFFCLILGKFIEAAIYFFLLMLPRGRSPLIKKIYDWIDFDE